MLEVKQTQHSVQKWMYWIGCSHSFVPKLRVTKIKDTICHFHILEFSYLNECIGSESLYMFIRSKQAISAMLTETCSYLHLTINTEWTTITIKLVQVVYIPRLNKNIFDLLQSSTWCSHRARSKCVFTCSHWNQTIYCLFKPLCTSEDVTRFRYQIEQSLWTDEGWYKTRRLKWGLHRCW